MTIGYTVVLAWVLIRKMLCPVIKMSSVKVKLVKAHFVLSLNQQSIERVIVKKR